MTDYELITFFYGAINSLQTAVMNYVAVLFAFLIAAYLIAEKLEARMVVVVVALFTLVTLQQVSPVIGFGHDCTALASQIVERAAADPAGIGWIGAATPFLSDVGVPVVQFGSIIVVILSYIGALIFFFHQRHAGRAQLPEITP